jgi:hypothetical protein
VGPRAGLDTDARGKILCLSRGSNLGRPVRHILTELNDTVNPTSQISGVNSKGTNFGQSTGCEHRSGAHRLAPAV